MERQRITSLLKILSLTLLLAVIFAVPSFADDEAGDVNKITDVTASGCSSASTYYENHLDGCWSCTLFNTMFTAINDYATSVYNRLAQPCITLMAILAAIYLAVFVMRYISALNEQKPAEFLTKLFGFLLRLMFVGVLLGAAAGTFSNLVVSPIIVTTAELSTAILDSFTSMKSEIITDEIASTAPASGIKVCDEATGECSNAKMTVCDENGQHCKSQDVNGTTTFTPIYCEKMKESVEHEDIGADDENAEVLNDQIRNALLCMINNMHYELAYSVSLGDAMMCYSWTANTAWFGIRYPSLQMLFTGIIIWIVSMLISVAYVFKLIDGIFRLGVLLVLLPLLAVAWVFPPTVEFAKKGFSMLIHVMMLFISLSLIIAIALMLVMVAFTSDSSDTSLYQLFNENRIYDMKDIIDFFSPNFIFAIVRMFIAFKLLDIADQIAMEFSGVSIGTSTGDQLSMTLARTASAGGRSVLTAGRTVASTAAPFVGAKFAGTKLGSRVASTRHAFHNNFTNLNQRAQQKFGFASPSLSSSYAKLDTARQRIVDIAGTTKLDSVEWGIKKAKEIDNLQKQLRLDDLKKLDSSRLLTSMEQKELNDLEASFGKVAPLASKERDKIEKRIKTLSRDEEAKQYLNLDAKGNAQRNALTGRVDIRETEMKEDEDRCAKARSLEEAYGKDTLGTLSLDQKAKLLNEYEGRV